jgi:hypothetical protein
VVNDHIGPGPALILSPVVHNSMPTHRDPSPKSSRLFQGERTSHIYE